MKRLTIVWMCLLWALAACGSSDSTAPTPDQPDTGKPLVDTDNDGVLDWADNCPNDANTDQADFDGDGVGDACELDGDGDQIPDEDDNCPHVANTTQKNLDGDSMGDACDDDKDGDGSPNDVDCDPNEETVHSLAPEICDGMDNNCDEDVDPENAIGCWSFYADGDQDGSGSLSDSKCLCAATNAYPTDMGGDCNDNDDQIHPWRAESCNDVDDNCNNIVDDGCDDDGDGYCDDSLTMVGTPSVCPNGGGDCYDFSPTIHPDAQEIPGNYLDDDCDGIKEGDKNPPIGPGPVATSDCTGMVCTGQSDEALLCGLDICYPGTNVVQSVQVHSPSETPTGKAWDVVSHFGNVSNDLAPFGGDSYVLLATGPATGTNHSVDICGISIADPFDKNNMNGNGGVDMCNDGGGMDPGFDPGFPGEPGPSDDDCFTMPSGFGQGCTFNNMEITLKLTAPAGVTGFSFDYIFFSEEYEEFIGTEFNDKFYTFLTAPQTTGGEKTIINTTTCLAPDSYYDFEKDGQKWCYIAINTAFSEPCHQVQTDITGTGFECGVPCYGNYGSCEGSEMEGSSTGWLSTSWPIQGGESFELTFHIHDTGDAQYDSEVILDNFHWEGGSFVQGTVSYN